MLKHQTSVVEKIESVKGYRYSGYAKSLEEFGTAVELPACNGWILQRSIPGTEYYDAMGSYPLFACGDWQQLSLDLSRLKNVVSFAAVTDPFGNYDEALLEEIFPDRVLRFKEHYVTDLSQDPEKFISIHHQRNTRKGFDEVQVKIVEHPSQHLEEWLALYRNVICRHHVRDIRAFSLNSFAQQFMIPGFVMFRALKNGQSQGVLLWYEQENVAYYHLGAYSNDGYETKASFALFRTAIDYFASKGCQWLDLGAGAGTANEDDGLSRFKRGWATGTRTAYFCGKILNPEAYAQLAESTGNFTTTYFPAYRHGEFCKKTNSI